MKAFRNKDLMKSIGYINKSDSTKCSKVKDKKTFRVTKNIDIRNISDPLTFSDMLPSSVSCSSSAKSDYSEESGTDLPGSPNVGSNSNNNVGNRSGLPMTSNKKHISGGIKFYPGLRLEAKDLGNDVWYAVKVVEVDQEEDEILIHFEKWSQRYDEWIPMDSSRLRPIQEPPGGFTKKHVKIFQVGDNVMATWSDSRKYPAKVKSVLGNERYEVLFYDGFTKNIKGGRMIRLSDEELAKIEQLKPGIGPSNDLIGNTLPTSFSFKKSFGGNIETTLGTKEERRERKRKLNVAELFHFKKRRRIEPPSVPVPTMMMKKDSQQGNLFSNRGSKKHSVMGEKLSSRYSHNSTSQASKTDIREMSGYMTHRGENVDYGGTKKKDSSIKVKVEDTLDKNRRKSCSRDGDKRDSKLIFTKAHKRKSNKSEGGRKLHSMSALLKKDGGDDPGKSNEGNETCEESLKRQGDWIPRGQPAYVVDGTGGPRKSIVVDDPRVPVGWSRHFIQRMSGHSAGKWDVFFVCPQGRKFRTRHELRSYFEDRGEVFSMEQFDFSLGRRKNKNHSSERDLSTCDIHFPGSLKVGQPNISSLAHPLPSTSKGISDTPIRRVKTLLPRVRTSDNVNILQSLDNDPRDEVSNLSDHSVAFGDLKIEKENDAYKCPKEGCCKNFRKESLLQMHMKHYHPEYNRFVACTPNVADLAYARTIGEPVEELHPRTPRHSLVQKISRFEGMRRVNSASGVPSPSQSMSYSLSHQTPSVMHTSGSSSCDTPGIITPVHTNIAEHHSTLTSAKPHETSASDANDIEQVNHSAALPVSGFHTDVPKRTIRTLMPVTRSSVPEPIIDGNEEASEVVDVTDVTPTTRISVCGTDPDLEQIDVKGVKPSQTPPLVLPYISMGQTKSLRVVRRRHMSDFHMEPVMRRRKPIESDESSQNTLVGGSSSRQTRMETLRREELVNCTCGYPEEDGLMIQCDLCLCWQHGHCNNIEHEDDVPEKYVCVICLHPPRERLAKHFVHDQDWLKDGLLPTHSFRSKNESEVNQRTAILKRTHNLIGTVLQLQRVIHSLRVKVNIAETPDHPKLYLWNQSWEKDNMCNNLPSVCGSAPQNISLQPLEVDTFKDDKCSRTNNLSISQCEKSSETLKQHSQLGGPVGHDVDGDLTECQSTDLEGDISDVCPARENANLLADDCDTKDTYFSQDSMTSTKGESIKSEHIMMKTDLKENLPQLSDIILDNGMNIENETEIVTITGETAKGDQKSSENKNEFNTNVETKEEHAEESDIKISDQSLNISHNNEISNKESETSKEIGHMEDNDLQLPFCQKDLMHLATSMANKLESLEAVEENQPNVQTQQRAPQPEAPIVLKECRITLLDHIEAFQQQVELRLTSLETQIAGLESMDPYLAHDENNDQQTKETVQMLLRDLTLLRNVASLS